MPTPPWSGAGTVDTTGAFVSTLNPLTGAPPVAVILRNTASSGNLLVALDEAGAHFNLTLKPNTEIQISALVGKPWLKASASTVTYEFVAWGP